MFLKNWMKKLGVREGVLNDSARGQQLHQLPIGSTGNCILAANSFEVYRLRTMSVPFRDSETCSEAYLKVWLSKGIIWEVLFQLQEGQGEGLLLFIGGRIIFLRGWVHRLIYMPFWILSFLRKLIAAVDRMLWILRSLIYVLYHVTTIDLRLCYPEWVQSHENNRSYVHSKGRRLLAGCFIADVYRNLKHVHWNIESLL